MTDTSWHDDTYPELRAAPPWVMEEMIRSEPGLVEPILADVEIAPLVEAVEAAARDGRPVVVTGCGTSEHAAMAIAALLEDALRDRTGPPRVESRQALEAALDPAEGGVCIAVSHDGGTVATVHALEAAAAAGCDTVAITARDDAAVARSARQLVVTPALDRSWCHTVAYVSALLAGAAAARALGAPIEPRRVRRYAEALLELGPDAVPPADRLASCASLRICGSGADRVTARELALKIEEGARLPATAHDLETFLHGHLAACDATTGSVVVLADGRGGDRRAVRAALAVAAAREIGMPVAAIVSAALADRLGHDETGAGRLVLPEPDGVPEPLASLLGGALALQLLTLGLAHARGTNPDLIRREEEPYRRAAQVAEGGGW